MSSFVTSTSAANVYPPPPQAAHDADDPYDAGKESPLVDTLVEGAVVLVIAALINVTFWGLIHFSDDPTVLASAAAIR